MDSPPRDPFSRWLQKFCNCYSDSTASILCGVELKDKGDSGRSGIRGVRISTNEFEKQLEGYLLWK